MTDRWTIAAVLAAAKDYLDKNELASSRFEAETLLAHALKLSRVDLYVQYDRPLDEGERAAFKLLLKDRLVGKPLQYITGSRPWRRLNLRVEPGVFIPRPETELLVEKVIGAIDDRCCLKALELGIGSGAVSLSLAQELSGVHVWAVDISPKSLAVARANAKTHGLEDKIEFFEGDLFDALPLSSSFDLIVANPPYIPSGDIPGLQREVRNYEPIEALDGGRTGLDFYEKIIDRSPNYLIDRGLIAFEVGIDQARTVGSLLESAGFSNIDLIEDYNGIERVVMGWKN